ncbi:hypothetical protein J6590_073397 [Homalodisca vitripennis]|nr:hypothetical protein J6590_073397 [Homalodisca vitripennis]
METSKKTSNNTNATMIMVDTFIVVTALASYSAVNTFMISKTSSLRQDHLYTAILHVCMVSMFYGQCVFLVHFSHITQSIASRFTRVTFKMERVVIRNHFRSLIPYQILNSESGSGGATSSTEGIPALIRDYWLLCDTVREANAFYGDQLLAVVLMTLIRTVIDLSAFVVIYNKFLLGSIYAGIWSFVHILFLLTLAYLCTNVTESADEMTHSVFKLINMDIDEELRDQLEDILLQLSNHKVKLSASGFFNMNYKTLTSEVEGMRYAKSLLLSNYSSRYQFVASEDGQFSIMTCVSA